MGTRTECRIGFYILGDPMQSPPLSLTPQAFLSSPHAWDADQINALKRQYGAKRINLLIMEKFLIQHPIKGVSIPKTYEVSSDEIENFLRENGPGFFTIWEKLKELYETQKKGFFQNEEVNSLISEAQRHIEGAFNTVALPKTMVSWANDSSEYFMVRSSSSEDNPFATNAGVNLSCEYVIKKDIPKKIAKVVASYVEELSLASREASGENPFAKLPIFSVIVQQLSDGGGKIIPVAAVYISHTQETTVRVASLVATFGHGQSVVNNRGIATDTFYIAPKHNSLDLFIWEICKPKPCRLAPIKDKEITKLQICRNPPEYVLKPCLKPALIKKIYGLGLTQEKLFGHPVNLELVMIGDEIHLVQVRPALQRESFPSYLDTTYSSSNYIAPFKVLTPGKATVLLIDAPSRILQAETLEEAQSKFQDHLLVVVRNNEPSLSHPIINLKERQITAIWDRTKRVQHLINEYKQIAFCIQGAVAQAYGIKGAAPSVKQGYISHPIPLELDLPFKLLRQPRFDYESYQSQLNQIKLAKGKQQARDRFSAIKKKCQQLLSKINYPLLKPLAKAIEAKLEIIFKELQHHIEKFSSDNSARLFFCKAVEVLLFGNGCSLLHLEELSKEMEEYAALLPAGKIARFDKEAIYDALHADIKKNWQNFLSHVEIDLGEKEAELLKNLIFKVGKNFSLWQAFFFEPAFQENKNTKDLLIKLDEEFQDPSTWYLEGLHRAAKGLSSFNLYSLVQNKNISQKSLSNESSFWKLLKRLVRTESFKDDYEEVISLLRWLSADPNPAIKIQVIAVLRYCHSNLLPFVKDLIEKFISDDDIDVKKQHLFSSFFR